MAIAPLFPSEAALQMRICFKSGRRPMLHGDPGTGKSQLTQWVADTMFAAKYGYTLKDDGTVIGPAGPVVNPKDKPWYKEIRAAQYDAVDLRGLYDIEKQKDGTKLTKWIRPEDLPIDPRGGVIFLDEINRGQEMVQNALFQALDQSCIGPHGIPRTWHMCSAINDKDGGTRKLSGALNRRFSHIDLVPSVEDTVKIASQRGWDPMVIAFLRFRPDLLHEYKPADRVGPNPRGWEFTSDVCKTGDGDYSHLSITRKKNFELSLVASQLGEPTAIEFVAFKRLWSSLPSIESVENNPETAVVPTESSAVYAICGAIARFMAAKNASKLYRYINRLPAEFQVACVEFATRRDHSLKSTPGYTAWAVANHSYML